MVHAGEVAVEEIDRFEKLFGLAVIIVHRMLKNSVSAREHLMFSEPAYTIFEGFFGLDPETRIEQLEGVGEMPMKVFYADQLRAVQKDLEDREGPIPEPSFLEILSWRIGVMVRTLLDQVTKRPSRARLQSLSDKGS